MASACINNVGVSPEKFMDCSSSKFSSYSWLSPRKSFSSRGEFSDVCNNTTQTHQKIPPPSVAEKSEEADLDADTKDFGDFEFCLEDNFTMLPADELFLDGKLMPLHLSMVKLTVASSETPSSRVASPQTAKPMRNEISIMDPYLFSPKAPRCTTRWKELLGLKRLYRKEKEREMNQKSNPSSSSSAASKSLKNLLTRSSKSPMSSSFDGSVNLPLLRDSETDSISISSSRLSLSSSSSSHEDLPRPSLDTDNKSTSLPLPRVSILNNNQQKAARPRRSTSSSDPNSVARTSRSAMRRQQIDANAGGISMESPRMNASGKIVYNSLERSCSSPSSYGGPRYKHSSVQRSYSANVVRVTPVLNVPVCSKSGTVFGLFGTQPKRDSFGSVNGANSSKCSHHQNQTSKSRQGSKLTTSKSEQ